ncbi:hypothetical protein [Streptomyces chrestomyceticus]|uniref:hypothetical protein n=1 Tax=Streptomyces chrestomyceticus TaxID=68185 RepID=UPI000B1274F3|nr:hypothetical protein [Streptomyces chrestomyceticus]
MIQNRRDARLAADLERNRTLLGELRGDDRNAWEHEIAQLEVLVRRQVAAVTARQTKYVEHRRNWASLGAVVLIVILAFPLLWLLTLPGAWWSWSLFAALLTMSLIMCGLGFYQTFNPDEPPAPEGGGVSG